MIDLTWKLFSQTGNIEAYLLLKDLEDNPSADHITSATINENDTAASLDTQM